MSSTENNAELYEGPESKKQRRQREKARRQQEARESMAQAIERIDVRIQQARQWWRDTGRDQAQQAARTAGEWLAGLLGALADWVARRGAWWMTRVALPLGTFALGALVLIAVTNGILRTGPVDTQGWQHTGLVAMVMQPLHAFLVQHSAGLPIALSTAAYVWEISGVALFGIAWAFRSTVARLGWVGWGAASAAMVWFGTAPETRPVSTGLAALVWLAASFFALRGLTLRPVVNTTTNVYSEFQTERS